MNGFQLLSMPMEMGYEQVINAYTRVLDELPLENNRYRIEHYQIITPKHLQKAVKYKLIPSMQTVQCTTDRLMMEERMGITAADLKGRIYGEILLTRDCTS
jgi:predicted amidohydrolase YtcJ